MFVGISLLSLREGGFIMSCKKNLRYLISAVFLTIVVMITAACSQKEIMEDAAGIETPPVVIAQQTPAVNPAAPAGGQVPAQYKNIDPSLLIYLSSRGVVAGTGDPAAVAGEAEKGGER